MKLMFIPENIEGFGLDRLIVDQGEMAEGVILLDYAPKEVFHLVVNKTAAILGNERGRKIILFPEDFPDGGLQVCFPGHRQETKNEIFRGKLRLFVE